MELLTKDEVNNILKNFGEAKLVKWYYEEFEDKFIGDRGDHLKVIIVVENYDKADIKLFIKCMPRYDEWKKEYLKKLKFFKKEYVMLSSLFKQFRNRVGNLKWRPELLYIREDLFVFEDVSLSGFTLPNQHDTMTFEEMKATVKTLARFHSESYILEENKSKELSKSYRIWDDFNEFLQEPLGTMFWRNTGRNAVIEYLKVYSKYKNKPNFAKKVETVITSLFDRALELMKPSKDYCNAVVHRDLWTNNIFIQKQTGDEPHVLFVDFQTVIYCSPMLDLTSLIFFNTTKADRVSYAKELANIYHEALTTALEEVDLDVNDIFPKASLWKAYDESIVFGITQAALIVPIIAMTSKKREEIYSDLKRCEKVNIVSRSEEFIEIAQEDDLYRNRVNDLLDDIVERFIYPRDKTEEIPT